MKINVSNGEILDKYSILEIKMSALHGNDDVKATNVRREYESLTPVVDKIFSNCSNKEEFQQLYTDLSDINQTLWNIEDQIREHEKNELFNDDFIELARSVYYNNDERAAVKKSINSLTSSRLVEEKAYEQY